MTVNAITIDKKQSMMEKLKLLYGAKSHEVLKGIEQIIDKYSNHICYPKPWVTEDDVMLITYGDSILEEGKTPLQSLSEFLGKYVKDTLSSVHILPFYPYTSDDGFSVVDYREIDPELGKWSDVKKIANDFDLMFDGVINHMSKSSKWFQAYLNDDENYKDFFIEADPTLDYSNVTRPRALPLLTSFETKKGTKYIWTTFSDDQIDLNFKNPNVLLEILDILIMFTTNGARYLRLDAIGFMWKKLGTTCMHLEETHALIKLIREVLDISALGTILITETNVPHKDNISYFGNGYNEAHLVYQFPLPPITLFSFHKNSARKLSEWAASLEPTTNNTTFFNFLSSHDGIGMRPTEGILTDEEKQLMVDKTLEHGGLVSYKDNGDGTKSPYELNINYFNALTHPNEKDDIGVKKFLAAHTILLSVVGVPGIYIHSLLGSQNDYKAVEESGINRRINREKLNKDMVSQELESDTLRSQIYNQFSNLIKIRRKQMAFSPQAKQEVLFIDDRVFSLIRKHEQSDEEILVLVNVSPNFISINIPFSGYSLLNDSHFTDKVNLQPYEMMWIKKGNC